MKTLKEALVKKNQKLTKPKASGKIGSTVNCIDFDFIKKNQNRSYTVRTNDIPIELFAIKPEGFGEVLKNLNLSNISENDLISIGISSGNERAPGVLRTRFQMIILEYTNELVEIMIIIRGAYFVWKLKYDQKTDDMYKTLRKITMQLI